MATNAHRRRPFLARVLTTLSLLSLSVQLASSFVNSPQIVPQSYSHFTPLKMTSSLDNILCSEATQAVFCGKNVLLTGASGGLGQALALQLAHCGVKTLILSARSQDLLQQVADDCHGINSSTTIHTLPCDLSNPDSVTALGQEAVKLSDVDILINNGGVSSRSRFVDTKPEVDAKVMQINFLSGASLAKAIVPGMIQRGYGSVIWISSVQGLCKYDCVYVNVGRQ